LLRTTVCPALSAWVATARPALPAPIIPTTADSRLSSSARVLEKCGFLREGTLRDAIWKDGVLMDAWLYARLVNRRGGA